MGDGSIVDGIKLGVTRPENIKGSIGGASSTIISNGVGAEEADDNNWVKHQQDLPFGATKPQFGASTYGLGLVCDGSVNTYYDVDASEYVYWDQTNSYSTPVDFEGNGSFSGGYKGSAYATYVAAPAGNTTDFFMFM